MKQCPKLIAWTLLIGLHLLRKEQSQSMASRKKHIGNAGTSGGAGSSGYAPMDLGNIVLAALKNAGVQGRP